MVTTFIHKLQLLPQSPYETAKKLHINLSIVYTRVIHFAVLKFGQGMSNLIAFIGRFFGHRGFYIYKETVAVQSIPCKKMYRKAMRTNFLPVKGTSSQILSNVF